MDKIIIYQIFTRLFGNNKLTNVVNGTKDENGCSSFKNIKEVVLKRISKIGVTHIWLTGVIRHATTTNYEEYGIPSCSDSIVKGKAGSPYAITDYYDVDPDLATDVPNRMNEFQKLVDLIHNLGMKVIIDFVPNHVAREYHSIMKPEGVRDLGEDDDKNKRFSPSNNFYYCVGQEFAPYLNKGSYTEFPARATGNDKFDPHPGIDDWYETVKLNYGVDYCDAGGRSEHFDPIPDTWLKMRDILMYWADKGIDGVRCDMAEMVPVEFWKWLTPQVKQAHPGFIFIGEVYNPSLYRSYIAAGFDYLYDKVGMYDCMRRIICGQGTTYEITEQWQSTNDINDHMLYFLENHDEQRIASDFFAKSPERAFPAVIASVFMHNNPFMIYAGQELGETGMYSEGYSGCDGRTSIFDYWTVETLYKAYTVPLNPSREILSIRKRYSRIINTFHSSDAAKNGKFFDLMYVNPNMNSIYAFLRKSDEEMLLVISNFRNEDQDVKIKIPEHAFSFLNIREGEYEAVDLLVMKHTHYKFNLQKDCMLSLHVKASYGMVLSFKF